MQRWIGLLFGYVTVQVVGNAHERFMNLCAVFNRDLWDYRLLNDVVTVNVLASEFKNLRKAARQAGVRLKIIRKYGLPFWLRKFRFRYGLVAGVLAFCLLLWFLSGRVWVIRLHGEDAQLQQTVLATMEEKGIIVGVRERRFDWATVRQQVMSACPEVAWMSLNPVGSVLNVDISRATQPPTITNHQQPCNLLASCDGTIIAMNIKNGEPMVQVGEGVVKGDLLVSGAVEYADGCTVFRKAQGEVLAKTTHRVTFRVPFVQTNLRSTGKTVKRYGIRFFGITLPLYIGSVNQPYEEKTTYSPLTINRVDLPIGLQKATFLLKESVTVHLTKEEAVLQAVEQADEYMQNELSQCEVLAVDYHKKYTATHAEVTAEILCKENIAFEENMLIF